MPDIFDEIEKKEQKTGDIFDQIETNSSGAGRSFAPTTWESMISGFLEPENLAGMIGGIAGGGLFGLPGAIGGAGIAGVGQKAMEVLPQYIASLREMPRRPTGEYMALPPMDTEKYLQELGLAGARQAGYEALGGTIAKGATKVLAPFARAISPQAKASINFMREFIRNMPKTILGKKRFPYIPAELTEHRLMDMLHNIAKGSIFGGGRMARYDMWRVKHMHKAIIDDLGERFGQVLDDTELADAVIGFFRGEFNAARVAAEPLYNRAIQEAGDISIPIKTVLEFAESEAIKIGKARNLTPSVSGIALLKKILRGGDAIDFASAQEMRSTLEATKRMLESATKGKAPALGRIKQISKLLDDAIEDTLSREHPEALKWWRSANSLTREAYQEFNDEIVKSLIKRADPKRGGDPTLLLERIFKPKLPSLRNRLIKTLGSKNWNKLKGWYVEGIIEKTAEELPDGTRYLNVGRLHRELERMGDKRLRMIFDLDEFNYLKQLDRALQMTQARQAPIGMTAAQTGSMGIQLTQWGTLVQMSGAALTGAGYEKEGIVIMAAPWMLARAFTNPTIAKYLTTGIMQINKGTERAMAHGMGNLARAIGLMNKMQDRWMREESEE